MSTGIDTLPAPKATEFLQGALLMVRRSFFNQAAVASPVQTSFDPENLREVITGGVGAKDPEGDGLTYQVVRGPQYGTVEVGATGNYVYTPGEDFTGEDSFSVNVISGARGINLLDLTSGRSTTVEVLVGMGAPTNPFSAHNIRDVALYLGDVPISVRVAKKNVLSGVQTASITLKASDDAPVTWLDDQGNIGEVSVADLAAQWTAFTSAGNVRLGVNFALEDDTVAALILTSVMATHSSELDAYVFSGTLAPDPVNGAGVDSYYDITGGSQKAAYENFRSTYLKAAQANGVEFSVNSAELYADSYSVSDYRAALQGADLGTVIEPGQGPEQAAAEVPKPFAFNGELLTKVIDFAKTKGKATTTNGFNTADPLFAKNPGLQPKCMSTKSCDGSFYPVTMYSAPKPLVEKVWVIGSTAETLSLNLSMDMGYTVYGYSYVPAGVWAKLKPSNYSAAVLTALTTGPSLGVMLGDGKAANQGNGKPLNQSNPITLIGPGSLYTYPPFFDVTGRIDATINARFTTGDPAVALKKLGAHLYGTMGLLTTYNVAQESGFDIFYSGAPLDFGFDDFSAITGLVISPALVPSLTASAGLLTPAATPLIGQIKLLALDLVYANPLSLDLSMSMSGPELRFSSVGEVSLIARAVPDIVKWLKVTIATKEVYRYTSDNLWAV